MEHIMGSVARDGTILSGKGFDVKIHESYEGGAIYAITLTNGSLAEYLLFTQQFEDASRSCFVEPYSDDVKYVNCPNGGVLPNVIVFSFIAIKQE